MLPMGIPHSRVAAAQVNNLSLPMESSNEGFIVEKVCNTAISRATCETFNIKILLTIAMVLPVSIATVERYFSDMKQIKDRLRNCLLPAHCPSR